MTIKLPSEIENQLLALRGNSDAARWQMADAIMTLQVARETGELIAERTVDGLLAPSTPSKTELTKLCADTLGIASSTARKYERMARTYDNAARSEFRDVMTFDGYAACMGAPEPLEFLRQMVASADDYGGKVPPVDVIRAKVRELNNGRAETPGQRFESLLERAQSALEDALELAREYSVGDEILGPVSAALRALTDGRMQ